MCPFLAKTLDLQGLERVKGIEPSSQAWEARILPLNHTRFSSPIILTAPAALTSLNWGSRIFPGFTLQVSAAAAACPPASPIHPRAASTPADVAARSFAAW